MKYSELFKSIDGCIFDLDGTLIDSISMWRDIDVRFFSEHNMTCPIDYIDKTGHMSFSEMAVFTKKEYGFEESVEEIKKKWNAWAREAYHETIKAKEGAKEFLKHIKEKGIPLSLATSGTSDLYKPCMIRNGIWEYFDFVLDTNQLNSSKSEPKIFLELAKSMNIRPERTLVFEDLIPNIMTAKKAGFITCGVEEPLDDQDNDELRRITDFYIKEYKDIVFD